MQQQQSSDFKINNVNSTSDNTSTATLPKYSDKLYNNNVNITEIKEHNNSSDINSDNSSNYVNASNISTTTTTAG